MVHSDARPAAQASFPDEIGPEVLRREILISIAVGSMVPAIGWLAVLLKWTGLLQVSALTIGGLVLVGSMLVVILTGPRSAARLNRAILARERRVLGREPDKLEKPVHIHKFYEPVSQTSQKGAVPLCAAAILVWTMVPLAVLLLAAAPPPVLEPRWADRDWYIELLRSCAILWGVHFPLSSAFKLAKFFRPLLRRVPADG